MASPTPAVRQVWPLLFVDDIRRSIAFYRDRLGFTLVRQAENLGTVFWCRLERGGASLMLQQADPAEDPPANQRGRGVVLYFLCDDADAVHADLSARGLALPPPTVAPYGMKQLNVPEPDGYAIVFESEYPG